MAPSALDLFGVVHIDRPGKVRTELDEFAADADALFIERPETEVTLRTLGRVTARTPTFLLGMLFHLALLVPLYVVLNRAFDEAEAIAVRRVAADRDLPVHEVDDHPLLFMSRAGPRWTAVNWLALAGLAWLFGASVAFTAVALLAATGASVAVARFDRRFWLLTGVPLTWGSLWLVATNGFASAGLLVAVLCFYLGSMLAINDHRNRHMLREVARRSDEEGYDRPCLVTGKAHLAGLVSLAPDAGLSVSRMHTSRWLRTSDDVVEDPDPESLGQNFEWLRVAFSPSRPEPRLGSETDVLGRRAFAACLDLGGAIVATLLGGVVFGALAGLAFGDSAIALGLIAGLTVSPFCYFLVPEVALGRTPGKWLLGLVVVAEDGSPASRRATLVRNLLRPVDFVPLYGLGFLAVVASKRAQRVGDMVAETVVVRAK